MMGYSLFVAVYGTANMYKLAIVDLGQVTFVFFILLSYLKKLNGKAVGGKALILSFARSPVILSIIAGIVFGATGTIHIVREFPLFESFWETFRLVSSLTVPVICIVIGYELRLSAGSLRAPLFTASARIALLFILAFLVNNLLLNRILHLDRTFQIALYTLFILPPPFVIPIFMEDCGESSKQFVLNTISIHIILSLFAYLAIIIVL